MRSRKRINSQFRVCFVWTENAPATRIHEIVKERRSITADTAERLARYFGGDAVSWLNLQAIYDLKTLSTREEIIKRIEPRTQESVS